MKAMELMQYVGNDNFNTFYTVLNIITLAKCICVCWDCHYNRVKETPPMSKNR